MSTYITEGAETFARTGKTARQLVIEEAFPGNDRLQAIASQEATYTGNCAGGRPSDAARTACTWVKRSLASSDPGILASPTAQSLMSDYLDGLTG